MIIAGGVGLFGDKFTGELVYGGVTIITGAISRLIIEFLSGVLTCPAAFELLDSVVSGLSFTFCSPVDLASGVDVGAVFTSGRGESGGSPAPSICCFFLSSSLAMT